MGRDRLPGRPGPLPDDRFAALETFLERTLNARERVRLKLLNPIGVATRLGNDTLEVINGRLALLKDDLGTLDELDRQLDLYRQDMVREFRYRLSHVDKDLHEFEGRGVAFFDDTLRLARVFDLMNKSRLKAEYEKRVVADTPQTIERSVGEIIDWMVAEQRKLLADAWKARQPGLPYQTPEQALVMASIVEKETGRPADRGLIAGVFINRLRVGMPLQTDPTVIYGLGESFDGNLRRRDLVADGPYNTYLRGGLPPTPIAMPSLAAIRATVRPDSTRALYFVARGDGTSVFSESLADHNRAVNQYQRKGGR